MLAFYDNILSPKTSQCVTIDIHAARAAYNKTTLTKAEESRVFRVQGNIELQQAYKRTAKALEPTAAQATGYYMASGSGFSQKTKRPAVTLILQGGLRRCMIYWSASGLLRPES